MLHIYLNDHLALETAAVELGRRSAKALRGTPEGESLGRLARDLGEDRAALVTTMAVLDVGVNRAKVSGAWVGEKLGRLKLNGSLVRRSPLSTLLELEGLLALMRVRRARWEALVRIEDPRLTAARLETLAARARDQEERVDALHASAVAPALGPDAT